MNRQELISALAVYLTTQVGRKAFESTEPGGTDGRAWAKVFSGLALKFTATPADAEKAIKAVLDAEATCPPMAEALNQRIYQP
jgi:hypothetical protein